jgi:hypothetical protein
MKKQSVLASREFVSSAVLANRNVTAVAKKRRKKKRTKKVKNPKKKAPKVVSTGKRKKNKLSKKLIKQIGPPPGGSVFLFSIFIVIIFERS